MVVNKSKKVNKYRGHTTHGGGHRKKRRGAGSRGGRGNAGTGKRANTKVAGGKVISGRNGFTPRGRTIVHDNAINVSFFTKSKVNKLVDAGKATVDGDVFVIDLDQLGYTKLLGAGQSEVKLKLKVSDFSKLAETKINESGGSISN